MLEIMDLLGYSAVTALVFCAAVVVGSLKRKNAVLAFLIGASAALVGVQILQVHVFTVMVVLWLLFSRARFDLRSMRYVTALIVSSMILAVTALTGDLVVSPTLALQLLALAVSASLLVAFSTEVDRRSMVLGLLAFATLSSMLGLLQVLKIAPVEIWHASVSALGRPIGLYPEPDWLGLFAGLGLIIAWRLPSKPTLRTIAITVNGAAFVLAFARAAWVAVAVSIVVVIVVSMFRQRRQKLQTTGRQGAVGLLALGAVGVLTLAPQLVADLTTRLANTFNPGSSGSDISGQARVNQIASLTELAQSAPFYGHGLSASGRVLVFGGISTSAGSNAVSSNWLLGMWVDGAFLALPIICLFLIVALRTSHTISGQLLVVVLLNSLFSNAFFFPITWMLVALCLAELMHQINAPSTPRPSYAIDRTPINIGSRIE
jgi:hypothetical protein